MTPIYEGWATNILSSFQIIIIIFIIIILLTIPLIRYVGKQRFPEMYLENPETKRRYPKTGNQSPSKRKFHIGKISTFKKLRRF